MGTVMFAVKGSAEIMCVLFPPSWLKHVNVQHRMLYHSGVWSMETCVVR